MRRCSPLLNCSSQADWTRAYGEINQFEHELLQHRVVLVKFWLAVSKDEQYRCFKLRETVAFKRFKITAEDWRNREQWTADESAVCDMVDRTSTASTPWTLVEANNKYHARIKVLRTLCEAVKRSWPARAARTAKAARRASRRQAGGAQMNTAHPLVARRNAVGLRLCTLSRPAGAMRHHVPGRLNASSYDAPTPRQVPA